MFMLFVLVGGGGGGRGKQGVLWSMWKWWIFNQNDWASAEKVGTEKPCGSSNVFQNWSMWAGYEELAGHLNQSETEKYFK